MRRKIGNWVFNLLFPSQAQELHILRRIVHTEDTPGLSLSVPDGVVLREIKVYLTRVEGLNGVADVINCQWVEQASFTT